LQIVLPASPGASGSLHASTSQHLWVEEIAFASQPQCPTKTKERPDDLPRCIFIAGRNSKSAIRADRDEGRPATFAFGVGQTRLGISQRVSRATACKGALPA